jgi:phosphatidylglycerophosphate synthase
MLQTSTALWLVHGLSISRLLAALIFASIAFQDFPLWFVAGLYLVAAFSDVIDGYLARKWEATTFLGQVVDLISDKSLTVVSMLYAAARGVAILPLAVIATRELIVLGLRIVTVDGEQLLPTSRAFGGVMASCLWGNTLLLLITGADERLFALAGMIYWFCALVLAANLAIRLAVSSDRIRAALRGGL